MRFLQYAIAPMCALLSIALSGPTAAAYSHNYTCGQPGREACERGRDSEPLLWEETCIEFYLDEGGLSGLEAEDGGTAPEVERVVEQAFRVWAQTECSGVAVEYGGLVEPERAAEEGRHNVVIFKDEGWPASSQSTFASTPVSYNPETGVIQQASIEVNDEFYTYSIDQTPEPHEADLLNTLVHEAGHFLGVGHSDVPEASMFGRARVGETKKRDLHEDDVRGFCDYYSVSEYDASCEDRGETSDRHERESGGLEWSEENHEGAGCASADGAPARGPWLVAALIGGLWWRRRTRTCGGS